MNTNSSATSSRSRAYRQLINLRRIDSMVQYLYCTRTVLVLYQQALQHSNWLCVPNECYSTVGVANAPLRCFSHSSKMRRIQLSTCYKVEGAARCGWRRQLRTKNAANTVPNNHKQVFFFPFFETNLEYNKQTNKQINKRRRHMAKSKTVVSY